MDIALCVALADEQNLVADAEHWGHRVLAQCSGGDELAARVGSLSPELVVVSATAQHLTPRLVAACDEVGVVMLVVADGSEQHRHARSLGILDVIEGPASWERLTPVDAPAPAPAAPTTYPTDLDAEFARAFPGVAGYALARTPVHAEPVAAAPVVVTSTTVADQPPDPEPQPERGTVLAVWGPHGAPGRTSIAVALAAEFAAAGRHTVLVDADTHAASVAPALGLLDEAPGFAAACRLAGAGALTPAEFERIGRFHRSGRGGFWVLTGLGRPSRWPELSASKVAGTLEAARSWADVTVVDVAASLDQDEELSSDVAAPRRNAAAVQAVRAADRVIVVAAGDPIGLTRFLRAHAELLELVEPHRISVVVNKVRSGAIGVNPGAQIRQTLARFGGVEDPVLVPWDPGAFDAALLGGRSLADAAPRSAARAVIRDLALARILGRPSSRGLRRR